VAAARGFTLTEILVVVSILAMLATAASIQLLRARIVVHEQLALNNLRQIAKACHFYLLSQQQYPPDLPALGPGSSNPPYLDSTLTQISPSKQGYTFTYTSAPVGGPFTSFTLQGRPNQYQVTGERSFFINQTLAVYATSQDRPANPSDSPIP